MTPVPRVVGRVRRTAAVELRDMQFLRANTALPAKITLPGPFAMVRQAKNEFCKDDKEMAMDLARGTPTEIDHLNGYVVRRGAALGIPTPANRALHALVKLLEAKQRGIMTELGEQTKTPPKRV